MKRIVIDSKKGNLRVGQTPDLHLGSKISDFNVINTQTGIYKQWEQQIEDLKKATKILIEKDISVVIFPGDIFDRTSNISEKLNSALRDSLLSFIKADVAVVLLTGNHDFPKTREYKALISAYDGIGEYLNVVPIYKAQYEKVNINDEILIHCIPQCFSKEQFKSEFDKVERDENFKVNVLTTHIGVQGAGIDEYEHAECWINKLEFQSDIDYVALGDYHRPIKVSEKVAYAGVLSKNNFSDKDSKHGVIVYHGDTKEIEFCEYSTRGMQQYIVECKDKSVEDINNELEKISDNFNRDNYIKVILREITKLQQKQLDFKYIIKMKREAFYCKISYEYDKSQIVDTAEVKESGIRSIKEEFKYMLENIIKDEKERERIFNLYTTKIIKEA